MKIEKKIWPEFYKKVQTGEKKFDIRLADFRCKPGDTLVMREWNPRTRKYTGRTIQKRIRRVVKTKDLKFWGKGKIDKYGLQVIGF